MGVGAGLYMCDVVKKSSRSLSHLLMSSCIYLYTGTDALVKKSVTSTDPEQVRSGWIMSTALDRKAHWLTALTTVGIYTTATTARMSQYNVVFHRQPVNALIQTGSIIVNVHMQT